MTTVLISGASVAGPTLAYWLKRHGFSPVVVERNASMRPGGQAIDIRGVAIEVVSQMGLLEAVQAKRTRQKGFSLLDKDGKEQIHTTERTYSAGRFDSGDIEILKDDLSELLYEATSRDVEYRFDDSIAALKDTGGQVEVDFVSGKSERFDLVFGTDGIYSNTRRLVFGPHEQFLHHLGLYVGIFTVPNLVDLKDWQIGLRNETSGMIMYPARDNSELRVFASFESQQQLDRHMSVAAQKQLIVDKCSGLGWEVPRLLHAMMASETFYFSPISQTRMPSWSKGRVALVGDAAYCPSPRSGQGTSLAMVGAYAIAQELARSVDPSSAFERCEVRMRPYVDANQALAVKNRPDEKAADDAMAKAKNAFTL